MRDADVIDLYSRVTVGTKVIVLANDQRNAAIDDQAGDRQSVSIERSAGGVMTARIATTGAQLAADSVRFEWNDSLKSFDLH